MVGCGNVTGRSRSGHAHVHDCREGRHPCLHHNNPGEALFKLDMDAPVHERPCYVVEVGTVEGRHKSGDASVEGRGRVVDYVKVSDTPSWEHTRDGHRGRYTPYETYDRGG